MNYPNMTEDNIRWMASRCGAYCEDGKPIQFDDFDIVKFANLVFNQAYRAGKGVDLFKEATA